MVVLLRCNHWLLAKKLSHNNTRLIHTSTINRVRNLGLDYLVYDRETTAAEKPPILVSHGLFGSQRNWQSLSKRLNLRTGRTVITYDAVNHGSSPHHDQMSYINLAQDLVGLMDLLKLKKSVLIGHSMGGKTVMSAALLHPEKVEKLVVVDAAPIISRSKGEVFTYMKGMKAMNMSAMKTRKDVEDEVKKFAKHQFMVQFLMANLLTSPEMKWRVNLDALINNYDYIHEFPSFPQKVSFNGPTKFIGGGNSPYIRESDYPDIKTRFPQAQICHIPDAGHWVHSDKPTEFIDVATKFINS